MKTLHLSLLILLSTAIVACSSVTTPDVDVASEPLPEHTDAGAQMDEVATV
jgi:hypothetical protein